MSSNADEGSRSASRWVVSANAAQDRHNIHQLHDAMRDVRSHGDAQSVDVDLTTRERSQVLFDGVALVHDGAMHPGLDVPGHGLTCAGPWRGCTSSGRDQAAWMGSTRPIRGL
jgi:hypothetical protein